MLLSKQELPVQVADFDNVRVSENNLTTLFAFALWFTCAYAKHCVILE